MKDEKCCEVETRNLKRGRMFAGSGMKDEKCFKYKTEIEEGKNGGRKQDEV